MRKYKCVLFDLDGTVIDSSSGVKKSILETIELMKLKQQLLPLLINGQIEI